ncbi:MAG: hypothetical protein BAJALOKI3v1_360016 [Promethearchaeota archaeon]|nr:MAG: hypothetical protein BAJALOKI3v1_360016 [Candidatus Lokiarchaeota archaeon]
MKAGFSKIKITPENYIGIPMAGYSRPDPCLGKLDDIFVRGILIESEESQGNNRFLLLLSFDLLKLPRSIVSYFSDRIIEKYDWISRENILFHATHTHSAPDLTGEFHWPGGTLSVVKGIMFGVNKNDKYIVWISHQVLKLIGKLKKSLRTAKLAWRKEIFNPNLVINRRHPSRVPETELGIISFKDLDDTLFGLIINYQCHPTTLSLFNNKLSADFPGQVISKISELTDNNVKSIYFNGPAGDLNPITTCGTDYKGLEQNKSPIYTQLGTYEHTKKLGFQIAKEALALSYSIPDENYNKMIKIRSNIKILSIPFRDARYFSSEWFQNKLIHAIKKYILLPVILSLYDKNNFPIFQIEKQGARIYAKTLFQFIEFSIGEDKDKKFNIFTVPGELFEDIGNSLLEKSPAGKKNSILIQNANDWIAYLFPIDEYVEIGGYEPVASFGPLCGYYIEREILDFFKNHT